METTLASASEQKLIGQLALNLEPTAEYVIGRRQAVTHSSVPSASYNGVGQVRVTASSTTEWFDPQSCWLSFTMVNQDGAKDLHFASSNVASLFSRCEIRLGGVTIEDQQHFNRLSETFWRLQSEEKRRNATAYGMGHDAATSLKAKPILAGASKRMAMTFPLSGILGSNSKWLPLWAVSGGLEILLTLARPEDVVATGAAGTANSTTYRLENIALHCGMCLLDSQLQNTFANQFVNGDQSLMIHSKMWHTSEQFLSGGSDGAWEASLIKPVSKLATVFCNTVGVLTDAEKQGGSLNFNTFQMYTEAAETFECQLQVGGRRFPEEVSKGATQAYFNLLDAIGIRASLAHSIGVDYNSYTSSGFTFAFDTEAVSSVMASGLSTQGGQEIRVEARGMTNGLADAANKIPKRAFIYLHYDSIVHIRANAVYVDS